MDYKIDQGKKSEVTLTVSFTADELKAQLPKAAARVSEHIDIKGFRKGHAPIDKVMQVAGAMVVYEHAAEILVHQSYAKILLDEKIEPLTQPKIEFTKLAPDNDFEYTATFVRIPSVTVGDITSITVEDVHSTVSDKDVEKVITDLKEYAAAEVLKDKVAEMGDMVEIDFEGFLDGVPFDGGKAEKYKLILGKRQVVPGFEENVQGMKAGETKEITITFPKDYHAKNLAGKKTTFVIKVHGVYQRTLPASDDSFAKLHGKETFKELREQVERQLKREEEVKQNQRIELEIIEALIKKSKFDDIPDILINQEVEKMIGELKQQVIQQGMQFTDYLTSIKKSEEELKIDFVSKALDRVKAALLTRTIFLENKMSVSDEELQAEIEKYKAYYQDPKMEAMLDTPEYRDMIRNVLGNSKVMKYLKSTIQLKKKSKE